LVPYTFLRYEKSQTRSAVKKRLIDAIERSELVYLKFSKQEIETKLYWEHAKEFEFEDAMYDVVESITSGDSIAYWCWADDDETILNQQLTALLKDTLGADTQHQEKEKALTRFFKLLYCMFTKEEQLIVADVYKHGYAYYFFVDYGVDFSLAVPPPELTKQV